MSNWSLGGVAAAVEERLAGWESDGFGRRLWAKDPTLWFPLERPEIRNRLGWLELPITSSAGLPRLRSAIGRLPDYEQVVLLGMGGSSLAPEVFASTFAQDGPGLTVLDSTHPDAVADVAASVNPERTVFVVSSKSGSTVETLSLFRLFWAATGGDGSRFVAITDPGSSLELLAREREFAEVFLAPPDVGGRYSALSAFGLVPAALVGVDVERLLAAAIEEAEAVGPEVTPSDSMALRHGAVLGEFGRAGVDKVTYVVSPSLAAFPDWLEQLVAESLGKDGAGLVPVAGEVVAEPDVYGRDRLFVHYDFAGDKGEDQRAALAELERAGHPVIRFQIEDLYQLGAEMYRAEIAVAAAGSVLGVHPFDQPDVQLAKELAIRAMQGSPGSEPVTEWFIDEIDRVEGGDARPGDYFALQAFLARTEATNNSLEVTRHVMRDRMKLATTVGYGPRFLHSTGQLHKGGPNSGVFLQIVDEPASDLPVPETDYTFGELIKAQSLGDAQALVGRGRRLMRVNLGMDTAGGLGKLAQFVARP